LSTRRLRPWSEWRAMARDHEVGDPKNTLARSVELGHVERD
jgi:hypothetical protein